MLVPVNKTMQNFIIVAAAGILTILGGCASFGGIDAASFNYSSAAIALTIPFEKQSAENLCGVAVADMITRYYGVALSTTQRRRLLDEANKTGGITGRTLKSVLQEAGYFTVVLSGSLDHEDADLYRHLDQGRPLVVMYKRDKRDEYGHYVVVVGYDPAQDVLVVVDPNKGQRIERKERFIQKWDSSGRFMLLAVPLENKSSDAHDLSNQNPNKRGAM